MERRNQMVPLIDRPPKKQTPLMRSVRLGERTDSGRQTTVASGSGT